MTKTPKEKEAPPTWLRNLHRLMDEQCYNPRSLSLKAGLNATAVRDMIEGRSRFPRYDTVQSLADALNTTPAQLMSGEKALSTPDNKGVHFNKDIELLTEIIARLQETATEVGRTLTPREFAAMTATIYRKIVERAEPLPKTLRINAIKPQIYDLLDYETLRTNRKKG